VVRVKTIVAASSMAKDTDNQSLHDKVNFPRYKGLVWRKVLRLGFNPEHRPLIKPQFYGTLVPNRTKAFVR